MTGELNSQLPDCLRSNVPVIGGQLAKATRLVIQCPDSLGTREELRVDSPGQCLKILHESGASVQSVPSGTE
jgi:hypothetical protein